MLLDPAENTALLQIGTLGFIDRGNRETSTNSRRQHIATFTAQRHIQTAEYIVRTQLAAATSLLGNCRADFRQRLDDR